MGVSEMRWTGAGESTEEGYKIIYSGGEHHERGVGVILDKYHQATVKGYWAISDRVILVKLEAKPFNLNIVQVYTPTSDSTEEEIDDFYEHIESALQQCKSQENTIILGDFNAKVGEGRQENVVGPHGLGTRNERGDRLVEWAKRNDFVIANTWFKLPNRRRWTWRSPGNNIRNQIDYILIKERYRNALKACKAYPGADCGSDHNPVIAKMELKLRKLKKSQQNKKLDLQLLKTDVDMKRKYTIEVKNQFEILSEETDSEEDANKEWNIWKESLTAAAEKVVPAVKKKKNKQWMTEEILDKMEERRKNKGNHTRYNELDKEIKRKCDQAKEDWLNKQCDELEQHHQSDMKTFHRKIKELSGKNKGIAGGCIKSKEGNIIMEEEKIRERWTEYIKELYDANRDENMQLDHNNEGPKIMEEEVRHALKKTKDGKAAGGDGIAAEMIKALEDFGVERTTRLLNKIYDTGEIPEDMKQSIFIALPKKPGATECTQHRTISLMSHMTKLLLRIIMLRIRSKVHPEIAEEQCGFMKDKGTRNAIYILRTLTERSIEVQKDLYLCFIDYTKAFDTIKHENIMKYLKELNIDGKDLRIIKNMYWEQSANIRIKNELGEAIKIKRGVRQGCVLSPDLFSLYSEYIMRSIQGMPGIRVGGRNINNLRYADDTVLIATTEKDLQDILNIIESESNKVGLGINIKKTETMVITKKKEIPPCNITLNGQRLKQVNSFKYLGALITSDGRSIKEVKSRIAQAKKAFSDLKKILTNQRLTFKTRLRVLNTYILPVLKYGSEAWTINNATSNIIDAAEMWFLRRMQKISYVDRVTNEEVLRRADVHRALGQNIRKGQATFFGHVMRKEALENIVTAGKIEGKRGRGRPREKLTDSLSRWLAVSHVTLFAITKDREMYRVMVTNAYGMVP